MGRKGKALGQDEWNIQSQPNPGPRHDGPPCTAITSSIPQVRSLVVICHLIDGGRFGGVVLAGDGGQEVARNDRRCRSARTRRCVA